MLSSDKNVENFGQLAKLLKHYLVVIIIILVLQKCFESRGVAGRRAPAVGVGGDAVPPRGILPPFSYLQFLHEFLSSFVSRLLSNSIFYPQKFFSRTLLWQRLQFSVMVTSVAVWNAP